MKIRMQVTTTEETYEVVTDLYVVVLWERKFKRKASDLAAGTGVEDLAYMAYESARRAGIVVPASFDEYLRRIVDVDILEDVSTNPPAEATDTP